jgi:predicted hydrocarbon binding protein
MNRKEFLHKSFQACLCYCGAVFGLGAGFQNNQGETSAGDNSTEQKKISSDLGQRMRCGSESPDWLKADKSTAWVKSMIDNIDALLDEDTKIKLLNACGRSCYNRAMGVADENKPSKEEAEKYLSFLENNGVKIERHEKTTVIYYGWDGKQNPWGLSIKEGYCLCPIVESGISDISPSYCYCSAGYVKEIIERYTGRQVLKVDVLESIRRGGKDCKFKVEIENS